MPAALQMQSNCVRVTFLGEVYGYFPNGARAARFIRSFIKNENVVYSNEKNWRIEPWFIEGEF